MSEIIYREVSLGADDEESKYANGIVVTLSYWHSEDFQTRSHYILESRVMINREIVVEEHEYISSTYSVGRAKLTRKAIAKFDQLASINPDCTEAGVAQVNEQFKDEPVTK